MRRFLIFLLAALSLSQSLWANTFITFGQESNGRQFSIAKGQVFRIKLASNPTTGYDWHMDQLNLRYFRFINSGFNRPTSKLMGAPGKKWFEFKAVKAGNCSLSLLYYRSWEGKHKAAEKYKLKLNINK
jgi:inhibitor of cysteine peptidase